MRPQVRVMFASTTTSKLLIWVVALLCPIQPLLGTTLLCHASSTTHADDDCGTHSRSCDHESCPDSMDAGGENRSFASTPGLPTERHCPPNCWCRLTSQPLGLLQQSTSHQVSVSSLLGSHDSLPTFVPNLRIDGPRRLACNGTSQESCAIFCRFLI